MAAVQLPWQSKRVPIIPPLIIPEMLGDGVLDGKPWKGHFQFSHF